MLNRVSVLKVVLAQRPLLIFGFLSFTEAKTDIQSAAQALLNQIVEVSTNLQTQVKATIAEHEKTHKQ